MPRTIYLASSWRNPLYPEILAALREDGHVVYDFRQANSAFHWREIDPEWEQWPMQPDRYVAGLEHPLAVRAFDTDMNALDTADTCVLALPCNRSAHLEAGYAVGQGKPTGVLLIDSDAYGAPNEIELMYRMVDFITPRLADLRAWLKGLD